MENRKNKICPCPNLDCPNHGNCEDCASRHLRIGSLNYCNFYAILPELEKAVEASPNSESARIIKNRIDRQLGAYKILMEKYNLSEEHQEQMRSDKSKVSKH